MKVRTDLVGHGEIGEGLDDARLGGDGVEVGGGGIGGIEAGTDENGRTAAGCAEEGAGGGRDGAEGEEGGGHGGGWWGEWGRRMRGAGGIYWSGSGEEGIDRGTLGQTRGQSLSQSQRQPASPRLPRAPGPRLFSRVVRSSPLARLPLPGPTFLSSPALRRGSLGRRHDLPRSIRSRPRHV